ncbi:cation-transporting P-type ATPase [Sediminibacterium roseum]|uniref:Cation-transporting P-type ATPase n=1 Tax=Sediminibacterium roseum TaxID=1978412 RepID=A0ABX0A0K7_9BACT|nr:cation-transporting P-type ATPase [Sediminibacterium roseum]NCI52069.1 cation-transporting P-type ATPase [Sediminibacterium roseum]
MQEQLPVLNGLNDAEVYRLRKAFGPNKISRRRSWHMLRVIWDICSEPMFILLLVACAVYFFLGLSDEGILMLVAMALVSSISLYQETKSNHAINALKQLTSPRVTALRNGKQVLVGSEELVPGDVVFLSEGMMIPADAEFVSGNDCFVNESVLTGESIAVAKYATEGENLLLHGTTLDSGKCVAVITATGNNTALGKIGKSIDTYYAGTSLLQKQVRKFVRSLALFGFISFALIFILNYTHYHNLVTSLLFALTLAMSVIPEEIPVAFSSFMALGAYRMSALGIVTRKPQVIENLGAVSVICLDKTGTITENKMAVARVFDFTTGSTFGPEDAATPGLQSLLRYAALASESDPFDPMEKAIWDEYAKRSGKKDHQPFIMIHEFPLEGRPPMMTHVYTEPGRGVSAFAKGALERIMRISSLTDEDKLLITKTGQLFAANGYRVIGIATAENTAQEMPATQDGFAWQFKGMLALYDPPRKNIAETIGGFLRAGIRVKMLTGDHPQTALNIAALAGFGNTGTVVTGDEVMLMTDEKLSEVISATDVFARMFPEAKQKVIEVLKKNGEIVAMTGDGVNDAPALHTSDIGIALGRKGTEIARQSADMVITDDDLGKIRLAIEDGRRIFINLVKSVRYIISIHIPIILTASIPVILRWKYPNIFSPIHVIFLELVMGPTCSIFFEREPVEKGMMLEPPRRRDRGLFTNQELWVSVFQGLAIAAAVLLLYYVYMNGSASIGLTRNIVFTTLLLSNVLLTFSSRSFTKNIFATFKYHNPLTKWILLLSLAILFTLQLATPVRRLFEFDPLSSSHVVFCLAAAVGSTLVVELYKWLHAKRKAP